MNHHLQDWLVLAGRIFFSLIFLFAGMDKFIHFSAIAGMMAAKGMAYSHILLAIAMCVELLGGLMIFLGWKTRLGGLLIFLFVFPVTFVFHSFWDFSATEATNQLHHFLKNLTIMGGALYIMAHGGGAYCIEGLRWGRERRKSSDRRSAVSTRRES